MNKKTLAKIAAAVVVVAGGVFAYRAFGWGAMNGPVNSLKIDLSKPDALVVTKSLSSLPRDLLTVPLARDVLREDFLFYYEQTEDRLGLKGSLRRIAYEHELGWGDQLIRMVLDEPAEVAMWRDADGSLKHYVISVSRGKLARVLEEAGKVALKDTQLTIAGELRVDGDKVPVYALNYAYQRNLLFAAHGDRMVILSHPGMLYGADRKDSDDTAQATVSKLLAKDTAQQKSSTTSSTSRKRRRTGTVSPSRPISCPSAISRSLAAWKRCASISARAPGARRCCSMRPNCRKMAMTAARCGARCPTTQAAASRCQSTGPACSRC